MCFLRNLTVWEAFWLRVMPDHAYDWTLRQGKHYFDKQHANNGHRLSRVLTLLSGDPGLLFPTSVHLDKSLTLCTSANRMCLIVLQQRCSEITLSQLAPRKY